MKIFLILLFFMNLMSEPANYNVFKIKEPISIDGDLSDWDEVYFIDSLHNLNNVIRWDDSIPWTNSDIQMKLYITWDDVWIYFAIKVTVDDFILYKSDKNFYQCDRMIVNPGGQGTYFYLFNDTSDIFYPSASCPYEYNVSVICDVNINGNGTLPTYEFAITRNMLVFWGLDSTQFPEGWNKFCLMIGAEDSDDSSGINCNRIGFGVEYTGPKEDHGGKDNVANYPWYYLIDSIPINIENRNNNFISDNILIKIYPNPFNNVTNISFSIKHLSLIDILIYDINGRKINYFSANKIIWEPNGLSNGIYILNAKIGKKQYSKRILLQR